MKGVGLYYSTLLLVTLVAGCHRLPPVRLPPVTEGWQQQAAKKSVYIVQPNDTLYSIAWGFGIDHRALAAANKLKSPYRLFAGQRLKLASSSNYLVAALNNQTAVTFNDSGAQLKPNIKSSNLKIAPLVGWRWPTSGRVALEFKDSAGNKGIDIAGIYGQNILASNHGVVVYSGTGIRSYGKLIIIKHTDDYLSAYAYNQTMLVSEGQKVVTGQKIATLGYNDEGLARLHFEIRRFGKPVNPRLYLPLKP